MSFVHYEYLFLLLILPFLYLFIRKIATVELKNIFSKEVLDKVLVRQKGILSQKTRRIFLLFALALMIVALARPVIVQQEKQENEIQGFNLIIALDISQSMNANDLFPSRLKYAKEMIYKIMDDLHEAKIAVIAFSGDAFLVSPFSEDFKSIKFLVKHLKPEFLSAKGSSLTAALHSSQKIFNAIDEKNPSLLILTDGADGIDINKAIDIAKDAHIKTHILNIGTKKGSAIYTQTQELLKDKEGNIVISKRDDSIASLAKETSGAFLTLSSNSSDISNMVQEIKNAAVKKEQKRDVYEGAKELFIYPLIVSLILVFFSFNSLRFFIVLLFIFTCKDAQAGIFDFLSIQKANESYSKKEYQKAAQEFAKIDSNEAAYNEANALYKAKEYEKALKKYKQIKTLKKEDEYKRLHNIGNTQANLKHYDEAIKAYEQALKIKEDEDTKYNLELLKQQKKQQQEQKKQDRDTKKSDDKNDKNANNANNANNDKNKNNANKDKDTKADKKDSQENTKDSATSKENQKDEKNSKKESKQNAQNTQSNKEIKEKIMSENEAKKWEKKMQNEDFKTQPFVLEKNEGNNVEITW